MGVGPLHSLLSLEGVSDVLINGPGKVWIERHGELVVTDVEVDAHELDYLIERMVAPSGARLDPANPIADARLLAAAKLGVLAASAGSWSGTYHLGPSGRRRCAG